MRLNFIKGKIMKIFNIALALSAIMAVPYVHAADLRSRDFMSVNKLCDHSPRRGMEVKFLSRDAESPNRGTYSATGYSFAYEKSFAVEGEYTFGDSPNGPYVDLNYMDGFGSHEVIRFFLMNKEATKDLRESSLILVRCEREKN
jgi:hypothetical protein